MTAKPFNLKRRTHARFSWLLISALLFHAALPVLAQAATQAKAADGQILFTICSMQGTKLVSLDQSAGQQDEVASSSQWCPVCLLHHLAHASLPPEHTLALPVMPLAERWLSVKTFPLPHATRVSPGPIRAPPKA